jgi:hypothetical protein
LPISHPVTYSIYLAKLFGPYATLGLAEDTWALNEEVLDDQAFLVQCYGNHEDRERMFFMHWKRPHRVCAPACLTQLIEYSTCSGDISKMDTGREGCLRRQPSTGNSGTLCTHGWLDWQGDEADR